MSYLDWSPLYCINGKYFIRSTYYSIADSEKIKAHNAIKRWIYEEKIVITNNVEMFSRQLLLTPEQVTIINIQWGNYIEYS